MQRLLIANRGEIALRIIRTAHRMGIETVAVYSETDAQALHVQAATTAYALGGQTPAQSYLDISKLIAAARATGADAVHPGYGFLSENPDFAQAVSEAGCTWVGPSPQSIRLLGSKASAKRLAIAAGVPCLPGYDGLDEQGQPSSAAQSDERMTQEASRIGWPLMVKAINGGGGRGMRWVNTPEELPTALASARQEALTAFGDASLLLERALVNPRHIEVQVFGDQHGQVIHLGERDCSVQRRNQKIIEESPSPALSETQRQAICQAAVSLAQAAQYTNAGTVEFLLTDNGFFLMEMNTRLQVEHPVTEMRYGVDLVEWQIRVARGEAIPQPSASGDSEDTQWLAWGPTEPLPSRLKAATAPSGGSEDTQWLAWGPKNLHSIELRLCAEDENFVPHSGQVAYFASPPHPLRIDHAITSGSVVSPYFDPMLGKLIAVGETRQQAIAQALIGLSQTTLIGLPNNLPMLAAILRSDTFVQGQAHIAWLGQAQPDLVHDIASREQALLPLAAAACALLGSDPTGPTTGQPKSTALACPYPRPLVLQHRQRRCTYTIQTVGSTQLWVQGEGIDSGMAVTWQCGADSTSSTGTALGAAHVARFTLTTAQQQHRVVALRESSGWVQLEIDGHALSVQDQSLQATPQVGALAAGAQLRAPMNGKVLAVLATVGQAVKKGDTLVVLESMKLEHRLLAARDGTVSQISIAVGQQAATGQLLVTLGSPTP